MNKPEILKKIKDSTLFSLEEKTELIELLNHNKRYGLVWEEKTENAELELLDKLPVLAEDESKAIINKINKNVPNHILIEGDNLHALTSLCFTHENKIDLIYIDPPYNTGSKDFKYNDSYVDKQDAYRHSKWLSFINKRLKLAKRLLKSTGVIFLSINEEELCQLKLLCDELFRDNYLATFTIKVRHEDRILKGDKDFHEVVEYLLMYRKSDKHKTTKRIRDNSSIADYIYQVKELIKKPKTIVCGKKIVHVFQPGEYEVIKSPPSKTGLKKINIRGSIKEGNSSGRFYMKYLEKNEGKGFLFKVPDMGNDGTGHRYFITPKSDKRVNGDYFQGIPVDIEDTKEVPYPNYFDFEEDFNSAGYEGGIEFRNGKKPLAFLQKIIEMSGCKNNSSALILDFFAGSGSTMHATMECNDIDGGKRQCILVTNNENNICEEITYERNKRVICGYTNPKGEKTEGFASNNLRYFRTNFVGREHTLKNKRQLIQLSTDLLRIKENCYTEIKGAKNIRIFNEAALFLIVVFDDIAIPKAVELIQRLSNKSKIKIYVFSEEHDPYTEDFYEVLDKIELCCLPDAIYKAYQHVLPKKMRTSVEEESNSFINLSI